jgi:hypothetical protein
MISTIDVAEYAPKLAAKVLNQLSLCTSASYQKRLAVLFTRRRLCLRQRPVADVSA